MGGFKLHFIKEKKKEKHSSNCIYIKIHTTLCTLLVEVL